MHHAEERILRHASDGSTPTSLHLLRIAAATFGAPCAHAEQKRWDQGGHHRDRRPCRATRARRFAFPRGASSGESCNTRRQEPPPSFWRQCREQWPRKGRPMGRDRQLVDAEQLRDPSAGTAVVQPAWVTPRSEGSGVSPAGCSPGCCGAAAGVLGRARGWLCILPPDLNHQKEEGWAAQALRVGVSRAGGLRSVGLQKLGTPGQLPLHLSPSL